ncbi:MAG: 30S ribosomal protein S17 [Candidatus Aenigmarchaeota archaeon]|nr:30S ribosomal protein S17 [Candidatus Aenigmarchaeota archaeon]
MKNIGVDAIPPKEVCSNVKCPWHGNLALRGRVFVGKVISAKANKTAVVEWAYSRYLQKYERYERRHSRVSAFNPECIEAKKGDTVKIMECRPLSKTKSFAVIEVLKK